MRRENIPNPNPDIKLPSRVKTPVGIFVGIYRARLNLLIVYSQYDPILINSCLHDSAAPQTARLSHNKNLRMRLVSLCFISGGKTASVYDWITVQPIRGTQGSATTNPESTS